MVLVAASADSEKGIFGPAQEFIDMGAFNDQLLEAGVLLEADGFAASTHGARIYFDADGPAKPEHGPFGLDNLVAGFWIWQLETMEQAIEWANKIPFKQGRVEIRRFATEEDFGPEIAAVMQEEREALHKKAAAQAN